MANRWKAESVKFDELYRSGSWETRLPYFGAVLRNGLIEREKKAIAFAGDLEGKTVLDLGCGVGRFSVRAALMGATVHGYDISAAAIAVAREKAEASGVAGQCTFHEGDLFETTFPEADIFYDLGCLQYIRDFSPLLAHLSHVQRFFSQLPRRGHWLNVPKKIYRQYLRGNPYFTYSEHELRGLFAAWGEVNLEPHGVSFNVTSPE